MPIPMEISTRLHQFRSWGCLLLSTIPFLMSGCAHYDMSDDLKGDVHQMIRSYNTEANQLAQNESSKTYRASDLPAVPNEFSTPTQELISQNISDHTATKKYSLESAYVDALKHSSQIKVFSDIPLIRETGIQEAKGPFDTNLFVESSYDKTNEPVGSTLTTGGPGRLLEDRTSVEAGVRKKFVTGTEVTVSEKVSHVNSNSLYMTPDPQNTADLSVKVVQPVLKGAGVAYNEATMRVAEIDSDIARQEFIRQSESHLLEVTRSYWSLYLARSLYFSKKKLVDETHTIVDDLKARKDVDSVKRQILRAEAAYAERKADLVRSESAVRNAQDRLVTLINDPNTLSTPNIELIPFDQPIVYEVPANIRLAATTAIETRPEIAQGILQLKAAAIREKMQRNEILPTLNLIFKGSLSGLAGQDEYGDAWNNQTGEGGPGYSIGVRGEYPLENNEALARLKRRKLELRQQFDQLQTTIETVLLEVKVSVREVKTAYRDLQAKYSSYLAAKEELSDLQARKDLMLGTQNVPAPTYLEYILDSQDRLIKAQDSFTNSLAAYNVAIVNLQKAQGTLLSYEHVSTKQTKDDKDLPVLQLEKTGSSKPMPVGGTPNDPKAAAKDAPENDDIIGPVAPTKSNSASPAPAATLPTSEPARSTTSTGSDKSSWTSKS